MYYLTTTPLINYTKEPAVNSKHLALAVALIAGAVVGAPSQAAGTLTTLPAVQVRPADDQIAQQRLERSSGIDTLAVVQVRPSAEQLAERDGAAVTQPITTLAAVQVRPSLEDRVALAAEQQAARYTAALAVAATGLVHEVIVNLPVVQVRPSASEMQALAVETAMVLVRP